jgi:hypothetical protein
VTFAEDDEVCLMPETRKMNFGIHEIHGKKKKVWRVF